MAGTTIVTMNKLPLAGGAVCDVQSRAESTAFQAVVCSSERLDQTCNSPDRFRRRCDLKTRDLRQYPKKTAGMPLALTSGTVIGLITAGRRECWGSQTSGAEGHRNHAMPFCFVLIEFPPRKAGVRDQGLGIGPILRPDR